MHGPVAGTHSMASEQWMAGRNQSGVAGCGLHGGGEVAWNHPEAKAEVSDSTGHCHGWIEISGCGNEVVEKMIKGWYRPSVGNHGRIAYEKYDHQEGAGAWIYYWDDRDGSRLCGWWIGQVVGGSMVWAFHGDVGAELPPPLGWRAPYHGGMDPSLKLVYAKSTRFDKSGSGDPVDQTCRSSGNTARQGGCWAGGHRVADESHWQPSIAQDSSSVEPMPSGHQPAEGQVEPAVAWALGGVDPCYERLQLYREPGLVVTDDLVKKWAQHYPTPAAPLVTDPYKQFEPVVNKATGEALALRIWPPGGRKKICGNVYVKENAADLCGNLHSWLFLKSLIREWAF